MASRGIVKCVALVLVVMLCHGATAQSGCSNALLGLSPCLNYVTGNTSTPSESCCKQLGKVVQSTPQCLCTLLSGAGGSMGISINQTLALALPVACKVQTPPLSQCNTASNGPVSSQPAIPPATSPVTSPSSSGDADADAEPANPTTTPNPSLPSGTASKTFPTTNGNPSDGSLIKPFLILFLIALTSTAVNF